MSLEMWLKWQLVIMETINTVMIVSQQLENEVPLFLIYLAINPPTY